MVPPTRAPGAAGARRARRAKSRTLFKRGVVQPALLGQPVAHRLAAGLALHHKRAAGDARRKQTRAAALPKAARDQRHRRGEGVGWSKKKRRGGVPPKRAPRSKRGPCAWKIHLRAKNTPAFRVGVHIFGAGGGPSRWRVFSRKVEAEADSGGGGGGGGGVGSGDGGGGGGALPPRIQTPPWNLGSECIEEGRRAFAEVMRSTTAYDLLPGNGKVLAFDTGVLIMSCFHAMVEHGAWLPAPATQKCSRAPPNRAAPALPCTQLRHCRAEPRPHPPPAAPPPPPPPLSLPPSSSLPPFPALPSSPPLHGS
jgi:hypothetical protein